MLKNYLLLALRTSDFSQIPFSAEEYVNALVAGGSLKDKLQITNNALSKYNKILLPERTGLQNIIALLLRRLEKKYCNKCETVKAYDCFGTNNKNADKKMGACLICHAKESRNYYLTDPQAQISRVAKRARKLDRHLTGHEIHYIFKKYENKCNFCGIDNEQHNIDYGQNLHLDHIHPVSKGGKTEIDNIQLLCRSCNLKKGNKGPIA